MTTVWFCILAFLAAGYAVLDGFDLGVGALYLFITRNEDERRIVLNSIGPVWDGNEVWLIALGGVLVLSFPRVYAAGFSGFYLALIMGVWLLMGRGLGLEWRAHLASPLWRQAADVVFAVCSGVLVFVLGIAVGNIIDGVPLNKDGYYQGLFSWMLNPYALLMGVFGLVVLTLHGANWLALKTDGTVQERARTIARRLWLLLVPLTIVVTVATFVTRSEMGINYHTFPPYVIVPVLTVVLLGAIGYFRQRADDLRAFLSSAGLIVTLIASTAIGLYPYLLPSRPHPERSFTVTNAASGTQSLFVGLIWISVGLVLVLAYVTFVYYLFRGKVVLEEGSHY
jgi:cytochrome bd ubiquinol oxidase subunit II